MSKIFEIVTTFDGDGGGLTLLSVLAAAFVALPDYLAAFPEVLGGLRRFPSYQRPWWPCRISQQLFQRFWGAYAVFRSSNGLGGLGGFLSGLSGGFGGFTPFSVLATASPCNDLWKFCVSLDWLKHHLITLMHRYCCGSKRLIFLNI